ncbi:hypothetical protein ACOMHN_013408 [Nucella lapillus]
MSLNKFMHPRNRYKISRPNFEALGQKYPEFKVHLVENTKGKPALDFQNPEALRVLTVCMLKEDYNLKIEIPPDRLVPTLPLRLNYVHWIEDITKDWNKQKLNAIDIGTGACCVYPILATSANPWHFLATEADDVNFSYAIKNMEENKLSDRIKVVKVTPSMILEGVIQTETTYDFCMCNPPFFSDHFEAQGLVSRSPSRPEAKTMSTASPQEGIVAGGEVAFIRRLIEESNFLQDKIRVYTTMLGKKASLAPLKEILRRYKITNFATTEFCQGKTMRWGLAWTFDKSVTFPKSLFTQGKKEGKKSVVHVIPTQVGGRRERVYDLVIFFKQVFTDLKIHFREGKQSPFFALLTLTAAENTWIHSRRKRRQMMRESATTTVTSSETPPQPADATSAPQASTSPSSQSPGNLNSDAVSDSRENLKDGSAMPASAPEDFGEGMKKECGSSKGVEDACDGVKDSKETGTAVEELSDSVREHSGSSVKPVAMDSAEGQEKDHSAPLVEQSQSNADTKKRKNNPETVADSPPAKRVKLEPSASLSNATTREKDPKTNSGMEALESSDCSPTKPASVDCPESQSMKEASNGVGCLLTSLGEGQTPAGEEKEDSSAAEAVSIEDGSGEKEKEKGEKGKDRPPAQFVLKCHMSVRVQGSDLAVELTWLDGQDIQLIHQLMQVFKNRLTQRKAAAS